MRPPVAGLFTLAVAATILAGDGLVLVPHAHAPGTPPEHPHGLALYRFPIALLGEPTDAPRARSDGQPSFRLTTPTSETLAGMSLLLMAASAFVVVRPVARAAHRTARVAAFTAEWIAATPTGPPRLSIV